MAKILIFHNERRESHRLSDALQADRHMVEVVHTACAGKYLLTIEHFDLVIAKSYLPDEDGIEMCKQIRTDHLALPIVLLSTHATVEESIAALDAGLDSYLAVPVNTGELQARVRALLRRVPGEPRICYRFGDFLLDSRAHRLSKHHEEIKLRPKEYELLEFFLKHPNTYFSAKAIYERCWPFSLDGSEQTVRTHMKALRKKLTPEDSQSLIVTSLGLGYMFNSDVHCAENV